MMSALIDDQEVFESIHKSIGVGITPGFPMWLQKRLRFFIGCVSVVIIINIVIIFFFSR